MSNSIKFASLSDSTPTLVFSGAGNVRFSTVGAVYIGGPSVTAASGFPVGDLLSGLTIERDDEIYAIALPGTAPDLRVFTSR